MKTFLRIMLLVCVNFWTACAQEPAKDTSHNTNLPKSDKYMTIDDSKLTPEEKNVILHKGTEMPFTGKYYNYHEKGIYTCKRCGAPLYRSDDKFDSNCGWPSFDDEIPGAVTRTLDADGRRTEITCANCGAHLGHVFTGEQFTSKNTRHCVNSISLNFVPQSAENTVKRDTAYFAGGCFWGVEHLLKQQKGVLETTVGFSGGYIKNPSYEDVCYNSTGHAEVVQVIFNSGLVSYETLTKLFFEIHDPTQVDGQGPDLGPQYRSEIFYTSEEQKKIVIKLIGILKEKGYDVVTKVTPFEAFYPAEAYHQDYYTKTGKHPYCHVYTKRF